MPNFKSDANVTRIAQAYALDAVDIALENFKTTLDWSEASIQLVEGMLKTMHEQIGTARPDEKTIWTFAKTFGSYVGEVFRKHHGGAWGIVQLQAEEFPGIQSDKGTFWPWGRVHQRLVEGPENNVWHYYQSLTASK